MSQDCVYLVDDVTLKKNNRVFDIAESFCIQHCNRAQKWILRVSIGPE